MLLKKHHLIALNVALGNIHAFPFKIIFSPLKEISDWKYTMGTKSSFTIFLKNAQPDSLPF